MSFELYGYQRYCVERILDDKALGLFLDMGMGKTVITLTAIDALVNDIFEVSKVLVIAPLEPARNTWPNEFRKWEHLSRLSYSLVLGDEAHRKQALKVPADVYITNREQVAWLVDLYGKRWPFDMVVIDELSSFKSPKSVRFKKLRAVRPYIDRIVGLTGTPAPNGLIDLWSQVYLLDQGKALERCLSDYRNKYFLPDKRNAQIVYSWKLRKGADVTIYDKISALCISMQSSDYLDLPDRLDIRHEIELPEAAMLTYKQLERDMIVPYEAGDIDAGTAAILANKLLQVAGGTVYDEFSGTVNIHDAKLEKLDQLIEEANGKPILVFYNYRHDLSRLQARYPSAKCVQGNVEQWNNGEIPILLAHPQSAGHGLNLQFGGNIIVWFGLPWSLEYFQQANKRLHRLGQSETVLVHYLLAKDTIDIRVLDVALTEKERTQSELLDAVCRRV